MKRIFTYCLMLFHIAAWAQNGSINGKVVDQNNLPISELSVAVMNHPSLGAITDSQGEFHISNIKEGNYTLRFTHISYKSKTVNVRLSLNETLALPQVVLQQLDSDLDEVTITGTKPNKFGRETSITVSKMPLKDIENPQVYNSISQVVLKEQIITNFDDALKNAPGIDKLWESTGRGGDGAGYFSLRGFAVQPTMVNGVPALTNGSPDIANIESIEVIKGPSGTLYGSSLISYGGLINVNTKRPFYDFGGNISYTTGTYGLNRLTADVNAPLSSEKKIALRLNTAYTTQNSFQDAGFKKSVFVAPSLAYEANDRLSFLINTEIYSGRSTNQTMLFVDRANPLHVHNMDELKYNPKRSYTSDDLYIETPTFNLQGQMNYKISDNWSSQTIFSSTSAKSKGYYTYLYEGTSTLESMASITIDDGIVLARSVNKQNATTTGVDIQQNFIGKLQLGSIENKLLVGLDYFNKNQIANSTGYGNQGFVYIGTDIANEFTPFVPALHAAYKSPQGKGIDDTGVLTQAGADAGIATSSNPGVSYNKTKQQIYSAYVSDVIYFLPQLSAMASLRVDRFNNNNYKQTAFSPKFGLVYQPVLEKVALFANYLNGFSNVAPSITPGGREYVFDPEQANQIEVGTKLRLLNDKLSATLSYYEVKVKDKVIQVDPETYIQGGKQKNKGFEAFITASPVDGLNIIAGYSYNDSNLESGDNSFAGNRPESAGPAHLANLWTSYKFNQGPLTNFGLGFGGNYGSENAIFNRNVVGKFTVPSYTVLNASAFYDIKDVRIALKLDNITDEVYYKGWSTINPQMPRIFSANLTYNF